MAKRSKRDYPWLDLCDLRWLVEGFGCLYFFDFRPGKLGNPVNKLLVRDSGQDRAVMVGGAIADPTSTSEPDVRISLHPAPEHKGRCHRHHNNEPYHCRGLTPEPVRIAEMNSAVFSTSKTPAIRPVTFRCLCLPLYPPHVSIFRALPQTFASLGASYSATAYGLAAFFLQRAIAGFPVPGVPCFVTLGWCFTPVSFRVVTMRRCTAWPEHSPFWACLSTGLASCA